MEVPPPPPPPPQPGILLYDAPFPHISGNFPSAASVRGKENKVRRSSSKHFTILELLPFTARHTLYGFSLYNALQNVQVSPFQTV